MAVLSIGQLMARRRQNFKKLGTINNRDKPAREGVALQRAREADNVRAIEVNRGGNTLSAEVKSLLLEVTTVSLAIDAGRSK